MTPGREDLIIAGSFFSVVFALIIYHVWPRKAILKTNIEVKRNA
jgi:hypothetical protein